MVKGRRVKLGYVVSFCAELWVALIGLQLAWDNGYRKIILETDTKAMMQLLTNHSKARGINGVLLEKCKDLINREWDLQLKHIL